MNASVLKEIEGLRRLTVGGLRDKYREVFGEESRSNHKDFLFRRIAWRLQANAEGGLSERAHRRALEIANDADLRALRLRSTRGVVYRLALRLTPFLRVLVFSDAATCSLLMRASNSSAVSYERPSRRASS